MKILCAFGKYQYGDAARGTGIEYEAFLPAFERLGHQVRHFETWDRTLYPTYADLNHALLSTVEEFQPEIVFTVQRDYEIWTDTLDAIQRSTTAALITWTTDDSFKFHSVSKYIGRFYDAIATTYSYRIPDYRAAGIDGAYLTQWAANSHWFNPPIPAQDCQYAVSFIGACYGARAGIVESLRLAGIHVDCFGFGWPNGSISTGRIPVLLRSSAISLNFGAGFMGGAGYEKQIKARTFEVPGAGGFLLTDQAPGLDSLYQIGSEIETYSGLSELERKIRHYLQHPCERDKIAQAGYRRTVACHSYEKRLQGLIEFALQRRDLRMQTSRGSAQIMERCDRKTLDSPKLGFALRSLRWSLARACKLVWGFERGPKAARKLVFAASRKIFGARTFSAMSLPGRMFPYV
jgi:spore maturation protein CgeB